MFYVLNDSIIATFSSLDLRLVLYNLAEITGKGQKNGVAKTEITLALTILKVANFVVSVFLRTFVFAKFGGRASRQRLTPQTIRISDIVHC